MTSSPAKRDWNGTEIDLLEWDRLRSDPAYCLVAEDVIGAAIVRTIWEGLDEPPGLPGVMFATGVALAAGAPFATVITSDTQDEARARHERVVSLVRDHSGSPHIVSRVRNALSAPDADPL